MADFFWAAASIIWFFFWPPTIYKVYRTKDVGGLSLISWINETVSLTCALVAGIIWGEWTIIISMSVFIVCTVWLIVLIIRYRKPCKEVYTPKKLFMLIQEWDYDTRFDSSVTTIIAHPIFKELKENVSIEFLLNYILVKESVCIGIYSLLHAIAGVTPVLEENRGCLGKMREDWIRWGDEKGYKFRVIM